jgi:hypothetical protein
MALNFLRRSKPVTIASEYLLFYWGTVFPRPKGVFLTVTFRIGFAHDTMA